jgi:glycosyltransferase involved in cell wall biosynthesis
LASFETNNQIGSRYDLIEQLSERGAVDPGFLNSKREFEESLKILRYSEAELANEKAAIERDRDRLLREHDILQDQLTLKDNELQAAGRLLEQAQGLLNERQRQHDLLQDQLTLKDNELQGAGRSLEQAQGLLNERQRQLEDQVELLTNRLAGIESSYLWRMTYRLRSGLAHRPTLRRILRRTAKLAYWTVTLQLWQRYHRYRASRTVTMTGFVDSGVEGSAAFNGASTATMTGFVDSGVERSGAFNRGWYGARCLDRDELFDPRSVSPEEQDRSDRHYEEATSRMAATYGTDGNSPELALLRRISPADLVNSAFAAALPAAGQLDDTVRSSFSIITTFYGHIEFFEACAASVGEIIGADIDGGRDRIEWIITNDDPRYDIDDLLQRIPERIRARTRILSDGENRGISARLNEACSLASSDWFLFLDCDDELEPRTAAVLDHYIARFPQCRYISSGLIDIDDCGNVVRWRRNSDPTKIFEEGMTVGHLKAVRRDLFDEVGPYRRQHSGCQDYDFALRTALHEPILCIPDYLYRYRWHAASQSVGRKVAQATRTIHVLREFLQLFADRNWPEYGAAAQETRKAKTDLKAGLCLIRTQGTRLELLAETVASVSTQAIPVTPCVIVHGSIALTEDVKRWLVSRGLDAAVVQAPDLTRKRGYPLNVGLDYLRQNAEKYDFFFFLDDDDIIYPFYSSRLTEVLNLTGADIGVCGSSSRVPWEAPCPGHALKPVSALVAGNFIPIHSYIVRTDFLMNRSLRVDEEMDYLEDWDFLISLFASDARFSILPEILCEYRIISDGNRQEKKKPIHYEFCRMRVMERAKSAAQEFGFGRFIRDLTGFDFQEQPDQSPPEIGHLLDMRYVYFSGLVETSR